MLTVQIEIYGRSKTVYRNHKACKLSGRVGGFAFMHEEIREYLGWKGTYAHRASINYKIWLHQFLKICGDKAIEEYNSSDIVKYHRWLEIHYSSYSIQYAMVVLKNLFKFFKLRDCKCLSPELIRLPRINIKSHRAVTETEYKKIIGEIPTNDFLFLRDAILIRMHWDTGMRVSELCDLDISQIDENKTSAIIFTKKTKTGKKRAIVWLAETHYLLMNYMTQRLEMAKSNKTSALFVGRNTSRDWSMRITTRTVQRQVRHYVNMAGIKEKSVHHSFRHGWAHKRRDNSAPLAFIQK